jgi:protein SDA1
MASHEFIPPDVLEPIIRKIAGEFVTGGVSFEVLQAGLISIREICTRAPLVMDADLLQDLTLYKNSRDKGVVNAARSLITLYREVAPELLLRKDRGKNVSMAMSNGEISGQRMQFGVDRNITTGIQGLELLEAWKKEQGELEDEDEGKKMIQIPWLTPDWKDWELGSEEEVDSNGSDGWIEVSSDEEHGIDISDSEDEEPNPDPPKPDPTKSVLATSKVHLLGPFLTKILTPADLTKLDELRAKAVVDGPARKPSKKSPPRLIAK